MERIELRYRLYSEDEGIPRPLQQLVDLAHQGKLTQFIYRPCGSAWDRVCALEDDLINASNRYSVEYEGWSLVAGECAMLEDVTGWLECDGWVFLVCPAGYQDNEGDEIDVIVIRREEFVTTFYPVLRGSAACGDDSGLRLHRTLEEIEALDSLLGKESG